METYHDETILQTGRFKGYKLCEIEMQYFINIYKSQPSFDMQLIRFVKENIVRILEAKEKRFPKLPPAIQAEPEKKELYQDCKKIKYPTKKEARYALKHIREMENGQIHKKPVRSYECEHCSMWHHTSMPIEVWKEIQKLKKTS